MTTNSKSFLAFFAAIAAAVNLSHAGELPSTPHSGGPVPPSQYHAGTGNETKPADGLPDALPPAEKISQTVFPIPDILCASSPNANKPTANHLEDAVTSALDDLRKPGRAQANTPGGPIVKVHPDAGILVFSGTWEQTELVRSTLGALKDTAQERESKEREKERDAAHKEMERSKPLLPFS
jgi:hypothetical protein